MTAPDDDEGRPAGGTAPDDDGRPAGGVRDFFLGKKETLLQSVVDGTLKALISGVVVAAAALIVLGAIETKIETAQKRAALQNLQNQALSTALGEFSQAYVALDCVRDPALLLQPDCKNRLEEMIGLLRRKSHLLAALMPDADFTSIAATIKVGESLHGLATPKDLQARGTSLGQDFARSFREMVDAAARHFN